jgi:hypothetical protein
LALPALGALGALRFWASVAGVGLMTGSDIAVLVALLLLIAPKRRIMQFAALGGALAVWRLPLVIALPLAMPRVILILPGLVSTWLANRRHPRARWSP